MLMLKRCFALIVYATIFLFGLLIIDYSGLSLQPERGTLKLKVVSSTIEVGPKVIPSANATVLEQHSRVPSITISRFKEDALKYLHHVPFKRYVQNLTYHQVNDIIRQVEIDKLTMEDSKRQFIFCAVFSLARRKGSPPDHIIIPKSLQKCKTMSFQSSGAPTALVSYPGSGNSWARVLLETATGIYTGSVYCDKHYLFAGMIGECVSTANVIAFKTHQGVEETIGIARKVIYIIRNPLKAIVAEYTRVFSQAGHTTELGPEHFGTNHIWNEKVKTMADEWRQHIIQWTQTQNFTKIVLCYEEMANDIHDAITKMLDFIEFPHAEEDIQCAIKSSSDEKFHRKHSKVFDPYTPDQKEYVLQQIRSVDPILKQYNISYL